MKVTSFALLTAVLFSSSAFADAKVCEIKVKRVACAGKDADAFKKCDGKAECTKKSKVKDEAACQSKAAEECSNSRVDITKSKEIWATFDGKAIKSAEGKDQFCDPARSDFNKC